MYIFKMVFFPHINIMFKDFSFYSRYFSNIMFIFLTFRAVKAKKGWWKAPILSSCFFIRYFCFFGPEISQKSQSNRKSDRIFPYMQLHFVIGSSWTTGSQYKGSGSRTSVVLHVLSYTSCLAVIGIYLYSCIHLYTLLYVYIFI